MPNQRCQPILTAPSLQALQKLFPCLDLLTTVHDLNGLNQVFNDFAQRFGFRMMGQLLHSRQRHTHWQAMEVEYMARDFSEAYIDQGFMSIDPVLRQVMRENLPLVWGLNEHRKRMSAQEKRLFGFLGDMNLHHGIILAIHSPGYTSILGMTDDNSEADFRIRLGEVAPIVYLFGVFVSETMHRLNLIHPHPQLGPNLTPREIECLNWAAEGKTAWETSQILSIAEATVIFHLENAKKKLNAKTLPQAVALAVGSGMIL